MKEGFNMIYVCGDVHGDYDIGDIKICLYYRAI